MTLPEKIAVIIPARNEEKTMALLILDIRQKLPEALICIIVNNSTDNTYHESKNALEKSGAKPENYRLITIDQAGKANAVKEGLRLAEADYYVLLDADGQHNARDIFMAIEHARVQNTDMMIGSRFLYRGYEYNAGGMRIKFNKTINRLVNRLFGVQLTDVLSGYRVLSNRFVSTLEIRSSNFELEMELLFHALKNKYRIDEIPIEISERTDKKTAKLMLFTDGLKILIFTFVNYYRLKHATAKK